MVEGTNIIDQKTYDRRMEEIRSKSSRPDFIGRTTQESIKYWDENAQRAFYKGQYVSGTINWVNLQLAKLGPRSWFQLGVMAVGGVSSAGAVLGRASLVTRGTVGLGTIVGGKVGQIVVNEAPGVLSALQPSTKISSMVQRHVKNEQDYANTRSRPDNGTETIPNKVEEGSTSKPAPEVGQSVNLKTKSVSKRENLDQVRPDSSKTPDSSPGGQSGLAGPSGQPQLSNETMNEIMQKGVFVPGVWGDEVSRTGSGFDINKIKQPELSERAMNEIMQKGVFVPGVWGDEVSRTPGTSDMSMPPNPFAKQPESGQSGLAGPSGQPQLSNETMNEIMQKGVFVPGVWGDEVSRTGSGFDINKIKQPELSERAMNEIMQKGVFVPGVWGDEVSRTPGTSPGAPDMSMPPNPFAKQPESGQSGLAGPSGQPQLSNETMNEIMQKGVFVPGVWGDEVSRTGSGFDINKIKQPELSERAMNEIMQKGVFVPGVWGDEVSRTPGTSPGAPDMSMPPNPFAKQPESGQSGLAGPSGQPQLSNETMNEIMQKGVFVPGVWVMKLVVQVQDLI